MKKLRLLIADPCSAEWEGMTPSDKGNYCSSCEKYVVDLSTKTDAELIQFFNTKQERVCGRLSIDQLHRDLAPPVQKNKWHWLLPLAIGIGSISSVEASIIKAELRFQDRSSNDSSDPDKSVVSDAVDTLIKGKVKTADGKPLAGVKVRRQGFENVLATTDTVGYFEFSVTDFSASQILTFDAVGYDRFAFPMQHTMTIEIPAERTVYLGMVTTISNDLRPLYLIQSGKKECRISENQFGNLPKEWIEKIEVLKDVKATATYGDKGRNGVIIIKVKKDYSKQIDFSKISY